MGIGALEAVPVFWLLCRARTRLCAVPLEHVVEIMPVLPIEALSGAPPFVRGLSIIRGSPVPVIDLGLLFSQQASRSERLVTITIGGRTIALSVEGVLGVRSMAPAALGDMPSLLRDAAGEAVAAIGTLDAEILLFLRGARIVPEAVLAQLPEAAAS
jgi:purine-binding chemotaxis protein CheW